jgi:hypothetical protein
MKKFSFVGTPILASRLLAPVDGALEQQTRPYERIPMKTESMRHSRAAENMKEEIVKPRNPQPSTLNPQPSTI